MFAFSNAPGLYVYKKCKSSLTDCVNREEILCNKSARIHEMCMRFFIRSGKFVALDCIRDLESIYDKSDVLKLGVVDVSISMLPGVVLFVLAPRIKWGSRHCLVQSNSWDDWIHTTFTKLIYFVFQSNFRYLNFSLCCGRYVVVLIASNIHENDIVLFVFETFRLVLRYCDITKCFDNSLLL